MPGFHPLVPLRVPSAWEVRFNNFVELGDAPTSEEREAYLTQDLLSIRSTAPAGPAAGWELDLGWHAAGGYRLELIDPGGRPAVRLETVHAQVARDAVALCLSRLNEGASPEKIQGLLDGATSGLS